MERPSAEAPRRRRWGPPVADLPPVTTPRAQAAPGYAPRTGRESTDGARLAGPRTATSRDACASTRDGPATTSTPQSSGRPADEPPESTTAFREKRRRRSRWDAPGDGTVAVARGPPDRPDAVAVVPTTSRISMGESRGAEEDKALRSALFASETKSIDTSSKDGGMELLPPAGVLMLPGGIVAKLPASFLCERDAPFDADEKTMEKFAELTRVNRAEICGDSFEDETDFLSKSGKPLKRSPSPEPVYGTDGARVNTRARRELEKRADERRKILATIKKLRPSFTFPESYTPPKTTRKIFVPTEKHPGYNFFGLVIGPRGNTQKQMQQKFGVKIVIRGRGSEKKASGFGGVADVSRLAASQKTEEPMHVLVTGDDDASVDAAAAAVARLLEPLRDEENEHKRAQLRELAVLNGTLVERVNDAASTDDGDMRGVGPGSALPPELQKRVAAQYEKDVSSTTRGADTKSGDHDAAYKEFLAEVGVATNVSEPESGVAERGTNDDDDDVASAVDRRKAYVGRLPPFANEHTVYLTFVPFGMIEKIEVVPDRVQNLPCRGFAFVQFSTESAARKAATYFSTNNSAFPHPPPPGFQRAERAMDVRVKADPRPPHFVTPITPGNACASQATHTSGVPHDPRCRLYVAKLPPTFSSLELKSLVEERLACDADTEPTEAKSPGDPLIVSCDVVVDRLTGLGRGFAFVRMRDARVAARVVAALDGKNVEGRSLVVRVAEKRRNEKTERSDGADPSPGGYPTCGGFVTPLSGDPYLNAGTYANPFAHYDPRAVAAAEAAVAAANPALAAAAAAEMAARATGAGPVGPAAFFPGAYAPPPGIFPASAAVSRPATAATIAPGDFVEAPPPPPP